MGLLTISTAERVELAMKGKTVDQSEITFRFCWAGGAFVLAVGISSLLVGYWRGTLKEERQLTLQAEVDKHKTTQRAEVLKVCIQQPGRSATDCRVILEQ